MTMTMTMIPRHGKTLIRAHGLDKWPLWNLWGEFTPQINVRKTSYGHPRCRCETRNSHATIAIRNGRASRDPCWKFAAEWGNEWHRKRICTDHSWWFRIQSCAAVTATSSEA